VQGHPKDQASFARCSGYVEQTGVRAAAAFLVQVGAWQRRMILCFAFISCFSRTQILQYSLCLCAADIHSPATTVHEALLFSATLRLPEGVGPAAVRAFVREIERVVEVEDIVDAIVGMPGKLNL
jgi:hypothetical protein